MDQRRNRGAVWAFMLGFMGLLPPAGAAAVVTLDDFDRPEETYPYVLGWEFPGARAEFSWQAGGAEASPGALAIEYDFTAGGNYVAWSYQDFFPNPGSRLRFRAQSEKPRQIVFRVVDSTGQFLQRVLSLEPDGWQGLEVDVSEGSTGWSGYWGGANDGRVHGPLTQLFLGPERSQEQETGRLLIDEVELMTDLSATELQAQYRAYYAEHPGFRARGSVPGNLFYPTDPLQFTLTAQPPRMDIPLSISGRVRDVSGKEIAAVGPFPLTTQNGYRSSVRLEVGKRGYFEIHWTITPEGDVESTAEARTCFAVIPENEHETPRPDSPFGVNVHFTQGWPKEIAALIQRVGIKWIRDHWGGEYDAEAGEYRSLDPTLLLAREHGLCYLPLSPYWSADRLEEVDGVWRHEAGIRQAKAYARKHRDYFDAYELYNEPNNFGGWTGRFGGSWNGGGWLKPFVDLGKQITQALQRGDPDAMVLWPEGDVFVLTPQFIAAGARPELNAIAPHTYSLHQPSYPEDQPFLRSVAEVKAALRRAGLSHQIWATEVGFPSFTAPPDHRGFHRPLTERQQADVLARMMILHLAYGITKVFYYDFYEDGPDPANAEHRFGIIRHGTLEPKPAVVAYANLIHWLTDARFLGRYPPGGNGEAFAFCLERQEEPVLVAWVKQGRTTEQWLVRSGATEVTLTDLFGRASTLPVQEGKLTITLTDSPVFVTGLARADVEPLLTPLPGSSTGALE